MNKQHKGKKTMKHIFGLVSIFCLIHCGGSDNIEIPESTTTLTQNQANNLARGIFLTSTLFDDGFDNQWDHFSFNTGTEVLNVDVQTSSCAFYSSGSLDFGGNVTVDYEAKLIDFNVLQTSQSCDLNVSDFTYSNDLAMTGQISVVDKTGSIRYLGTTTIEGSSVDSGVCGFVLDLTFKNSTRLEGASTYTLNGEICNKSIVDLVAGVPQD